MIGQEFPYEGIRILKAPFFSQELLNLSGVKHAQSRSEIGNYRAIRRLETPGFWAF
jgi:hypothetical protein